MSQSTAQVLVAGIFCVGFVAVIFGLARRDRLSFQYTMGWLSLFTLGIVAIIALPATNRISRWLRVTPAALLALCGLILLLMICIQLSISISGLQKQVRRLAEEVAKLRLQVEENEKDDADQV